MVNLSVYLMKYHDKAVEIKSLLTSVLHEEERPAPHPGRFTLAKWVPG
jgi:hypothetical protein